MKDSDNITIEYIERFITFFATSKVVQRGRKLYDDSAVHFIEHDDRTDTWDFLVEGTKLYRVKIKGVDAKVIETSCSCPFDWGSVCKHSVASLFYISELLSSGNATVVPDMRGSNKLILKRTGEREGFELTDYKNITKDFIRRNTSSGDITLINYSFNQTIYDRVEIAENSISFIETDTQGGVLFYQEDGKVYVTSEDENKTDKLTASEAKCLTSIANSPLPNLLDEVFSQRIKEKEKNMLADYGIDPGADFSKYFTYWFSGQGLAMKYTKLSTGLLPVTPVNDHLLLSLIDNLNSDGLQFALPQVNDVREIGFVIAEGNVFNRGNRSEDFWGGNDYGDYDDYFGETLANNDYGIVAIIGKPNKNGTLLSSHIVEYDDEGHDSVFQINKSKNTELLLNIVNKIDNEEDEPKRFELWQKAYELLLNEKFVFGIKKGKSQIRKSTIEKVNLSAVPIDILFEVSKSSSNILLNLKIKIGDEIYKRSAIPSMDFFASICTINDKFHIFKNYRVVSYILQYPKTLKMVQSHKDVFFDKVIRPISRHFQITYKNGTYNNEPVELDFVKKQVFLSEHNEFVVFTLQVVYDNNVSALLHTSGNVLSIDGNKITEYIRNFGLENDFVDFIAGLHPGFEEQKSSKKFYLHYNEFMKNLWFYNFFDQLHANSVEVYGLKELKNFKYSPYKGKISTSVSSGQDWFDVNIDVSFGDNRVSLSDIKKAVVNNQRYIQLKDGSVGILPVEWVHKLERYFRNGEIRNNKLEISKLRFSVVDELFDNLDDTEIMKEITEKRARLASFSEIERTKVPKQVKGKLRHYQKEGLNWLNFLDEMQWGGILADDMGLGKTLQVLTFLQHQVNKKKPTNLIVVPTTLLFNWENEIEKFTPALKALYYHGTNRIKDTSDFKNYNIVFTTYGILLRDIEILSTFEFNYVILDESQAIKNPASRRFKAANLIRARNRIALTGTPIENGTFDLYAQMSFANRGFFGGSKAFKENYSNPIDKEDNELIAGELQRIVNPFVLRRTKENVASELPPKTEDIIYCEMENGQRKVYDAYRNEYKNRLLNTIEKEGIGKSKLMVLEALTRLRQICDSPALLNSDEIAEKQSVKIKEIMRHITNKTGNHKILIFSQFVKMLGLIKSELEKLNIDYAYLDGKSSIKQREKSVNNFQENENLRVFLISLKAGGTGLNLTAADYVYIVDPWWNPAVENQAIDRCYRIGQDKNVFAYRMICTNTVEEKIINLQNRKKKIAGDIIQTDENIMKKLDVNEIKELFS